MTKRDVANIVFYVAVVAAVVILLLALPWEDPLGPAQLLRP